MSLTAFTPAKIGDTPSPIQTQGKLAQLKSWWKGTNRATTLSLDSLKTSFAKAATAQDSETLLPILKVLQEQIATGDKKFFLTDKAKEDKTIVKAFRELLLSGDPEIKKAAIATTAAYLKTTKLDPAKIDAIVAYNATNDPEKLIDVGALEPFRKFGDFDVKEAHHMLGDSELALTFMHSLVLVDKATTQELRTKLSEAENKVLTEGNGSAIFQAAAAQRLIAQTGIARGITVPPSVKLGAEVIDRTFKKVVIVPNKQIFTFDLFVDKFITGDKHEAIKDFLDAYKHLQTQKIAAFQKGDVQQARKADEQQQLMLAILKHPTILDPQARLTKQIDRFMDESSQKTLVEGVLAQIKTDIEGLKNHYHSQIISSYESQCPDDPINSRTVDVIRSDTLNHLKNISDDILGRNTGTTNLFDGANYAQLLSKLTAIKNADATTLITNPTQDLLRRVIDANPSIIELLSSDNDDLKTAAVLRLYQKITKQTQNSTYQNLAIDFMCKELNLTSGYPTVELIRLNHIDSQFSAGNRLTEIDKVADRVLWIDRQVKAANDNIEGNLASEVTRFTWKISAQPVSNKASKLERQEAREAQQARAQTLVRSISQDANFTAILERILNAITELFQNLGAKQ